LGVFAAPRSLIAAGTMIQSSLGYRDVGLVPFQISKVGCWMARAKENPNQLRLDRMAIRKRENH